MEYLKEFIDIFLHIDKYLEDIIKAHGTTTYLILFAIIFIETGLVIMPLLPGDSLLFAAGMFAGMGFLDIYILLALLLVAAILGDTVNYFLGKKVGLKVLHWRIRGKQLVKQEYIDKTHTFYEKYGAKTIVLARFVPIVRTFAPFVAGIGEMSYGKFISYNVIGGAVWVIGLTLLGYFAGEVDVKFTLFGNPYRFSVREHFEFVILGIIFVSVLPMIIEGLRQWRAAKKAA
jgi:membrane-associated protein